ncbi:hypothetical protein ANCCEY_09362 [Ancylostoma ceylanicum]|uniref:Uncharacterized protein n=1 Tax=Ancylostoma ceylanicum TaxID=53326 RepID=A0A0D6LHI5_9BILA|nr:hypothetical protein ANCCEY_09362 [Ancylostoma ceylanicum]
MSCKCPETFNHTVILLLKQQLERKADKRWRGEECVCAWDLRVLFQVGNPEQKQPLMDKAKRRAMTFCSEPNYMVGGKPIHESEAEETEENFKEKRKKKEQKRS